MNIFKMSEQELEDKLTELKSNVAYRDIKAVNRKELMRQVDEIEARLYKLKTMNKKAVQNLRALNDL